MYSKYFKNIYKHTQKKIYYGTDYCCTYTTNAPPQLVFYHIEIISPPIFHMTDPGELADVDNYFETNHMIVFCLWGFCEN